MTDPRSGAAWLREPLLHFLLIGAALFLLFHFLGGGRSEAPREIVVGEARVEALAENFAKTWMRPPTAQELKGLADDYVAEEVYYREAIAMGLDRDDTVIRRRLRQKMEFISEDLASTVQPTDSQLQEYLEKHADKFVRASRLTFQQVFFSGEKRGQDASRDAERLLAELQAGRGPANPLDAGDPRLLPAVMESASSQEIANTFGSEFAAKVEEAPVGQWAGPFESGYGVHVVLVDQRDPGVMPTLAEIRPLVEREWASEQRTRTNKELLDKLLAKYEVRIEGPLGEALKQAGQQDAGRQP
jgi:hypothetical protein